MFPAIRGNSSCVLQLHSYLMSHTAMCLIDVIYPERGGRNALPLL